MTINNGDYIALTFSTIHSQLPPDTQSHHDGLRWKGQSNLIKNYFLPNFFPKLICILNSSVFVSQSKTLKEKNLPHNKSWQCSHSNWRWKPNVAHLSHWPLLSLCKNRSPQPLCLSNSSEENALHYSSFSPLPKSTGLHIYQEAKHTLVPPSKHKGRGTKILPCVNICLHTDL